MSKTAYINGRIVRETKKALLISCALEAGDEPFSGCVWFQRSQITDAGDANADLPEAIRAVVEPARIYAMPIWLARKSGVCFGTRL